MSNPSLNTLTKNKTIWAGGVLILILIAFYRDIVFAGRTFLMETAAHGTMPGTGPYNYQGSQPGFVVNDPGAIASQIEPFNRFISRSIKSGDFPLWNPYAGLAGSPLLADGHTGPLEPLQFLFFFLPTLWWPLWIDVQLLIRFFIAGFTCYLFARRQRIDVFGSIAAAIVFMLSSYFVTYGNHPQIKTEALLPLVLYGYDRLVDPKDRLGFWLCALFIGWAVIAAMPEATFFSLLLGTLWYFYKSIIQWQKNGGSFQDAKNLVLRYSGSTVFGYLISAAYLLPFLEFVSLAKSSHAPGTGSNAYGIELLPGLIFQTQSKFFLHTGFFALFSLVLSLLNLRDWLKYRQHIVFFSLYAVIFLSILFGFPLTNWIRDLPVFNQLVLEKYPIPSIVFCLAILTGILIDTAKDVQLSYWKLSLSLVILLIVFIGIPRIQNFESVSAYSSDLQFIYIAFRIMIGISILLYALTFFQRKRIFPPYLIQLTLLILVVLEPFFWGTRIKRPNRVDPFQTPPFVSFLEEEKPFRIFGLDGTLYPNIATAYGVADIRWLNALVTQRAFDFSNRFIESKEVDSIRLTGMVLPVSNRMFDLLNVKYVFRQNSHIKDSNHCSLNTDRQPYFGKDTINPLIYEQNQGKKNFFPELPLSINGATRLSIFAEAPQRFDVDLLIPKGASRLDFSIGLNPKIFLPQYGDGVTFKILLLEQDNKVEVFSKYIDPKNNPCDRKWFDESIRLEKWSGKEVTLRFTTAGGPSKDTAYDWAYWGDIRLTPDADEQAEEFAEMHYNLVYQDQDVLIYQDKAAFPRAFVVYQVKNVPSFDSALNLLSDPSLNLRQVGVVENLPVELENSINRKNPSMPYVGGSAKLINSGQLDIEVNTEMPGLLIVSDQYYPGWKAYVDGRLTPIYAVDGMFRGIFLNAGEHIVEFKYRPLSFIIGGIISAVSLLMTQYFLIFQARLHQKHHE